MASLEQKAKSVFIICPVRNMTEEEKEYLDAYVKNLEEQGADVHYPPRDTNQNDTIGFNICSQNKKEMKKRDEIHVFFNPDSTGTLFDIGMAFALGKPVKLINKVEKTEKKSFSNVLNYLNERGYE